MILVKFYRVKQPSKFSAKDVYAYSQALVDQARAECSDKVLGLAIKMAEKALQERMIKLTPVVDLDAVEDGNLVTDSESNEARPPGLNRSRLAMSLHVIKEE